MAGIDFMAFANGMMQADKLNKEDETYWRKQAAEDRAMQYQERDQAYKELEQGYKLNTFEDYQQNKEAAALSAQAYDAYVQKAKALGVPVHQVIMDSPAFELPNATPAMQARFNEKLNNAIQTNIIAPLRVNRDFESANRLIGRLGLPGQGGENPMLSFGDPEKEAAFIAGKIPGASVTAEGAYTIGGESFTRAEALLLANSNPASAIAAIVAKQNARLAGATTQAQQAQIQQTNARTLDVENREIVRKAIVSGYPEEYVSPHLRDLYRTMKGAAAPVTQSGSPPITASVEAATMPVRQSTTPTAPMPVRQSTTPMAPMPVAPGVSPTGGVTNRIGEPVGAAPQDQWQEALAKAEKAQSEVNALEAQRAELKKDLGTMSSLAGRKHFDPATIENAKRQLAELNSLLSLKSTELDSIHAQVRQAPVARPGYVNILNDKYKVKQ